MGKPKTEAGRVALMTISPAAQSMRKEANATGNEFSDLAASRKVPEHTAANDTPLTRTFGQ